MALVVAIVAMLSGASVAWAQHQHLVDEHNAAAAAAQRVALAQQVAEQDAALIARVRTDVARAALAAAASEREQALAARDAAVAAAEGALSASQGKSDQGALDALSAALTSAASDEHPTTSDLRAQTGSLDTARAAVEASAAAWEQARQAQEQEGARQREQQKEQERRAARAQQATEKATTEPSAPPTARSSAGSRSIEQVASDTLAGLPGSSGVAITWDDPDLGNHLGTVRIGDEQIMLNSRRLAGNPSRTADVVRHELAHIYQARVAASSGLGWDGLVAAMEPAFGSPSYEKAADCVALRFGASWTWYTKDCSAPDKQAWVDALIGGRTP